MTSLSLCLIFALAVQAWMACSAPIESASFLATNISKVKITHQGNLRVERNLEVPPPEIMRFMKRFGYLESNPSDSESLYHESAIVEAIKNIQKYGALNQTGKLDNETLELFNKPRCGVPDMGGTPFHLSSSTQRSFVSGVKGSEFESDVGVREKRFVIGAPTWKKRRIRYFIANWSLKIPKLQVERDIARAFALWSQYSGLRFKRVNDTNADIIVGFGSRYHGDNFPFDGPGNILAHAYYPYEMGSWGGDVHFDEDENWKENSTDLEVGVDFYAVAAHEIGHSLGLAHSPHYNSIMFPYYKGPGIGTTMDYDDTLAMYSIYLTKVLEDDYEIGSRTTQELQTTESIIYAEKETSVDVTKTTITPFFGDHASVSKNKTDYNSQTSEPTDRSTTTTLSINITTIPLWPKTKFSKIPNICNGKFDAVSVLNGTIHIFKNEYVYQLTSHYTVMSGYPLIIHDVFPFLPIDIKNIDAVYQRYDGAALFFTGDLYWVFSYVKNTLPVLIGNSPLPVSDLFGTSSRIDAAMMWPRNNLTYLFSGSQFWRFNDRLHRPDDGYPKSMRRWIGIPSNIDAAATLSNGKTYFFKDNLYWLYDNTNVRPMRGYPRRASSGWLHCKPTTTKKPLRNSNTTVTFIAPLTLGSI